MSNFKSIVRSKFLGADHEYEAIREEKIIQDIVPEFIQKKELTDKINKLRKEVSLGITIIESNLIEFAKWVKRSYAIMITMLLIGLASGMFISKVIYDSRMDEIIKSSGYAHKGHVYDVKLRQ